MAHVAKLVIVDAKNKYLLMYRSAHPVFGEDPDLPGGTLEKGEQPVDTMIREAREEAGIIVDKDAVTKAYEGNEYSAHGTVYSLFTLKLDDRPHVMMSWEHSTFEWLERDVFLKKAAQAQDTYMHMVHDVMSKL
jgi:8-oxo-dGTP pyrophosphatase MutT (NUDIX family)